jgi:Ribonuclease G/E
MHTEDTRPNHENGRRRKYIVSCPACYGTGRVMRDDSLVATGCRLCWERGVVAQIVADSYSAGRG